MRGWSITCSCSTSIPRAAAVSTNADAMAALDEESPDEPGWPCYGSAGEGVWVEGVPITWAPGTGATRFPEGVAGAARRRSTARGPGALQPRAGRRRGHGAVHRGRARARRQRRAPCPCRARRRILAHVVRRAGDAASGSGGGGVLVSGRARADPQHDDRVRRGRRDRRVAPHAHARHSHACRLRHRRPRRVRCRRRSLGLRLAADVLLRGADRDAHDGHHARELRVEHRGRDRARRASFGTEGEMCLVGVVVAER